MLNTPKPNTRHLLPLTATTLLLFLSACGKPPAQQQQHGGGDFPAPAVVARAEARTLAADAIVAGSLQAPDEVTLVAELDATVQEIAFSDGAAVNKGDLLFKLDDTATKAHLVEAKAHMELARLTHERNTGLLANKTIAQQEYDSSAAALAAAEATLALADDQQSKTRIKAPFAGIMSAALVSKGQFAARGTSLASCSVTDPLEAVLDLPERFVSFLSDNTIVTFRPGALGGQPFEGAVTYVAPTIDENTRSIRIHASIPNPDRKLKAGMFGEATVAFEVATESLVIPESCVQLMGGASMVVALGKEFRTEFRPVTTGRRLKGFVEITSGLSAGEYVVVEGYQKMGPGMRVAAAPESRAYGIEPGIVGETAAPANPAPAAEPEQDQATDETR